MKKQIVRQVNALISSLIPEMISDNQWVSKNEQKLAAELSRLLKAAGFSPARMKNNSPILSRHMLIALRWATRLTFQGNASPTRKADAAQAYGQALAALQGLKLQGKFLNAASLWAVIELYAKLSVFDRAWLPGYVAELKALADKRTVSPAVAQAHEEALRVCKVQHLFKGSEAAAPSMYLAYLEGYFRYVRQEMRRVRASGAEHARLASVRKGLLMDEVQRVLGPLYKQAQKTVGTQ